MDDTEPKKGKGFWGAILRSQSLSIRPKNTETRPDRRLSDGDVLSRRRRPVHPVQQSAARGPPKKTVRVRDTPELRSVSPPTPLTEWPPHGFTMDEELLQDAAVGLIAYGAPSFRGRKRPIPHAPEDFYALYATPSNGSNRESDRANLNDLMAQLMTFRMQGPGQAKAPWETLEQPSCSFMFGQRRGTVTLNHWTSLGGKTPESIMLRDSGVLPRPMDLFQVLERLRELQAGLEDDDEALLYKILYRRILKDPERIMNPHKTLDKQITDLILVLSRADWTDYTDPKNHIATRHLFSPDPEDLSSYHKFLHQLLLSLELELRIHSTQHTDWAKEKLLSQIPPKIRWSLALARRWKEYVRIDGFGSELSQIKLRYKLKKRQVKMLKTFAKAMKWPNLDQTLESLAHYDDEFLLDQISSDAYAFFSGLAMLSHMHPNCGFQYRNSYTYWPAVCIVGKVLAPTCNFLAGWVGPARPTNDLGRSQIARIRTRNPRQTITRSDVESMAERSEALGPAAEVYPVREYVLVSPDGDRLLDTARIELLSLRAVPPSRGAEVQNPGLFDATIQFAIDGVSWPLNLSYDVNFVSAWPCSDGPHPLFFDYLYKSVPIDDLVHVQDWGGYFRKPTLPASARSTPVPGGLYNPANSAQSEGKPDENQDEEVLVIEAMGVKDNEVLARAWCAHWGLNAVVAEINTTCMACAVRECYAATLTVLILVEDREIDTGELYT
ncbi:hypothetical protein VHEMI03803 [[Torrubiella] hemipterigena]|uniref:VTC domain-containing protein n=1 Tax=[Torrubiella] hemipterigena TaxID=1531966 RepID=A0A0A1STL0_9HYPO|nr:hypothetical protein VHEMI03803 [[Torrubiella] hemipterigena]